MTSNQNPQRTVAQRRRDLIETNTIDLGELRTVRREGDPASGHGSGEAVDRTVTRPDGIRSHRSHGQPIVEGDRGPRGAHRGKHRGTQARALVRVRHSPLDDSGGTDDRHLMFANHRCQRTDQIRQHRHRWRGHVGINRDPSGQRAGTRRGRRAQKPLPSILARHSRRDGE